MTEHDPRNHQINAWTNIAGTTFQDVLLQKPEGHVEALLREHPASTTRLYTMAPGASNAQSAGAALLQSAMIRHEALLEFPCHHV